MPFRAGRPDPDRKPTAGELLDIRHELDEQTFESIGGQIEEHQQRIADLERAVAVLEALLVGNAGNRHSR
jgi:hypothetical protein